MDLLPRKRQTDSILIKETQEKSIYCKETCDLAVENYKKNHTSEGAHMKNDDKQSKFSADGVYSYYKSFVARFLDALDAPDHNDEHNLMLKIELTQKQLEKLRKFSNYSTKIDNSSIQDATDILKNMIIGVENQNIESLVIEWLNRIEEKFGSNHFYSISLGSLVRKCAFLSF